MSPTSSKFTLLHICITKKYFFRFHTFSYTRWLHYVYFLPEYQSFLEASHLRGTEQLSIIFMYFHFVSYYFYAGSGAVLQNWLVFTITFEVDSSLLFTWGRLKRQVSKHLIAGLSMEKSYLTNMVLGSPLAALPQIFLFHILTLFLLKARSKPSAIVAEEITWYKIRWQASKWRDIHGLSLTALVVIDCKSNSERVDNFPLGW